MKQEHHKVLLDGRTSSAADVVQLPLYLSTMLLQICQILA